jgi:luciferase-like monooxygenase
MATSNPPKQSLKMLLVEKLQQIPGISHTPWPERDDGFSTLHYRGKEIGHFHNFQEIDLRLGRKLIKAEELDHYPDSKNHPNRSANSIFIERRFANVKEVEDIVRLVQIAVEAP